MYCDVLWLLWHTLECCSLLHDVLWLLWWVQTSVLVEAVGPGVTDGFTVM